MILRGIIQQLKKVVPVLALAFFTTLVQAETASNEKQSGGSSVPGFAGTTHAYHFPRWPERKLANREIIPPPPPGPYMSSALSDFSVKGPSFGSTHEANQSNKTNVEFDSSRMPIEMFSPDRPWPDNLRPNDSAATKQWLPENGYQYVKPNMNTGRIQRPVPVKQRRNNMPVGVYPGALNGPYKNMPAPMRFNYGMPGVNNSSVNNYGPGPYSVYRVPGVQ